MKHSIKTILLPLLTAAIWGTAFVAQDVCATNVPPFTFNAIRFAIAVLFLLSVKWTISVLSAKARIKALNEREKGKLKTLLIAGRSAASRLPLPQTFSRQAWKRALIRERRDSSPRCTLFSFRWLGCS